ncbi:Maf family nucleotide pyrophosphatase [Maribacter hydrothermalis]|uniref:dTTP/UTP pyrophosphatase n=1 Tax=Maribacter hydrothermalis TaxID=1836467 RepID=A0A1B7Z8V8_9FLAO|nr:Maf family nucleotide pyrophosphatase [Maribacter hydrothermalis]APQ18839.1 septum formation protein Maf [Maribacter hydrothermalis]OBR39147.1 septum formation protein Maf [Maribacter hydrothermalis]
MLHKNLKEFTIILASGSPRRHQFFMEMGLDFEVRLKSVNEEYPSYLKGAEISDYLAKLKAEAFKDELNNKDILITSDTVVWHKNESLAKAANAIEAEDMLRKLSGNWHQVITSVCFTTPNQQTVLNSITKVKFKDLTTEEIQYYIKNFKPFDKAGAYGIQEWIGLIGIEEINGSYTNVVGLPTTLVYETLINLVQ